VRYLNVNLTGINALWDQSGPSCIDEAIDAKPYCSVLMLVSDVSI